jgi:histidine ammonia-lyase
LLLFEGWSRLSRFEQAWPAADRLGAAYPGGAALAGRVLSLHRSLTALDPSHAIQARATVERTAPAIIEPGRLWTELGELEEERGRPDAALATWQHLLASDSRNPERLLELATLLWDYGHMKEALAVDALKGTDVAFDERIHQARPHPGQLHVARNLRRMLEGSEIRESHRGCGKVQDAYSLRCIPQVHGAVRDTLAHCREVFEIEMNSAVDNPLVFPREKQVGAPPPKIGDPVLGDIISGGNFHGEPLAFALDFLAIALSALAGISERRLERLVNPALNEGLPPFLAPGAGLNSGFMMPQVTAAALVSESKVWSHPASVDSITTSGNKEDFVSMGMTAANKLLHVIDNTRNVLAIEAMAVAQALDFRAPMKTGKRGQAAHAAIRSVSPTISKDRILTQDFARVAELIASGKLADVLR